MVHFILFTRFCKNDKKQSPHRPTRTQSELCYWQACHSTAFTMSGSKSLILEPTKQFLNIVRASHWRFALQRKHESVRTRFNIVLLQADPRRFSDCNNERISWLAKLDDSLILRNWILRMTLLQRRRSEYEKFGIPEWCLQAVRHSRAAMKLSLFPVGRTWSRNQDAHT